MRVRDAVERRAWVQAKRVPWPELERKAHAFTEWQVLALWVRAAVDTAAGRIPGIVQAELDRRAPAVVSVLSAKVNWALRRGERPGAAAWEALMCWAEMNLFLGARRGGWLDALHYFSAVSFRSMKAWSYWELADASWQQRSAAVPTFSRWEREVASAARISSNAESPAQRALDAIRRLRKADWNALLAGFIHLHAFSVWMGLVLDGREAVPNRLTQELRSRYPAFGIPDCGAGAKELLRHFHTWALKHQMRGAKEPGILEALRFCARHRAECVAARHYAQSCWTCREKGSMGDVPTFDEWKEAADTYFERL